ncbi:hypothetical protein [Pseudonocardia sp. WMMC193]|uniref:hypothetical protein n=1 Tax=Pseudonocardia sp. WMMC193 TaxID=2911965 RepID=UPI001F41E07D|nr:hypothetical protein [Pseudonocardia sp. WMMC193]MCF7552596.1 hypothetical protein [Pseudonocardia sp. WMMC193]
MKPGYALIVVCVVSLIILGILIAAVLQLQTPMMPGPNGAAATPVADPNAGTVAALAGAALAALSSLTAAYFGIKVASEQSAQVAAQANATASHALAVLGNSTSNGNPNPRDF